MTIRAIHLTAPSRVEPEQVYVVDLPDGGDAELRALQALVGDWVEPVHIDGGVIYIGEGRTGPVNSIASCLAIARWGINGEGCICGNAVVVGPIDIYGRDTDIVDEVEGHIMDLAGAHVPVPQPIGFLSEDVARWLKRVGV